MSLPRRRRASALLSTSLLALGLVTACGGGGGGDSTPPPPMAGPTPPANSAPVFTSAATANVPEDTAAGSVFYTAVATDADRDSLTYTISAGADASRFQITGAGALSFVAAPDFENPTDADQNNVYLVEIRVSDGKASAVLSLAVTVTDDGRVRFTNITQGVAEPSGLFFGPNFSGGGTLLYYIEQFGRVGHLGSNPTAGVRTRFHTFTRIGPSSIDAGLLGFVFGPGATPPSFPFYSYLTNEQGDIEVRRHSQSCPTGGCNPDGDVILLIPHPTFRNNYGGFLEFGPDGMLYIGVGDGGGAFDPSNNAQNTNSLLGKILRIDPSRDAFPDDPNRDYAIPAGNPFAGGGGRPEIWALGFRNPVRGAFDAVTGNLYIGDRGEPGRVQEINLLRPSDGGANFGWPFREGTQIRVSGGPASPLNPIIEYVGQGATGGNVYRGTNRSFLNQYFFGDLDGRVFSVPVSLLVQGTTVPSSSIIPRTDPGGSVGSVRGFAIGETIYIANGTAGFIMAAR